MTGERGARPGLRPCSAVEAPSRATRPKDGVNVVGYLGAEAGIGEAARLIIEGLRAASVPVTALDFAEGSPSRQRHPVAGVAPLGVGGPVHDVNLICVNAEEFDEFAYKAGPEFFAGRRTVAFWWWELPVFPERYRRAFGLLDEVWVGSDYVAEAIRSATSIPVLTVPFPVAAPPTPELSRSDLGLPDGFMFLFSFDFYGVFERKNPIALIEAFSRAFPPGKDPILVVKSINGSAFPELLRRLHTAAAGRSDIVVLDRYLDVEAKDALTALCDCYVSLHRAEGFGLTIAEAMARGKPAIATAFSGNLTFMDGNNSYLVPYEMVRTPNGCAPYPPGIPWAEPDVGEAARLMRRVHESREDAHERGSRARADLSARHSIEQAGAFISARLGRLHSNPPLPRDRAFEAWLELVVENAIDKARTQVDAADEYLKVAPERFGAPVRLVRRVLWRLLWPYFFRERALNSALLSILRTMVEAQKQQARRMSAVEDARVEAERDAGEA